MPVRAGRLPGVEEGGVAPAAGAPPAAAPAAGRGGAAGGDGRRRRPVTEPAGAWGDRRRRRIGLLGGSFNPAHEGHRHVARRALAALRLDQVWLMVSPGNPLKPARGMAPFAARLASAQRIADGRRVVAMGIEARLGTRYT